MKTLTTKFIPATNTRGSRVRATDNDGNAVSIPYPHVLTGRAVHDSAVRKLCEKMDWHGKLIAGNFGSGYIYIWVQENEELIEV